MRLTTTTSPRRANRLAMLTASALVTFFSITSAQAQEPTDEEPPPASPESVHAIVITFDSGFIDAGFSADDGPRVSEPLHLKDGRVSDWSAFEASLRHVFQQLRVDPETHPVLMSEPMGNTDANREKMTRLMFETFKVPGFFLGVDGALAIYGAGRTTGIAVTSPDGLQVVPVFEGHVLPHAVNTLPVGRRDVAQYAMKLLGDRSGHTFSDADEELVAGFVDQFGYVAEDYDAELHKAEASSELERNVELPDGQTMTMGAERFKAPEILFKPALVGHSEAGLHTLIFETIQKCDRDVRNDLFANVVIGGRTTLTPGIDVRLTKELVALAPSALTVKVVAPPERKHLVWSGGSILASLAAFKAMWVTRAEYDASGPTIIKSKSL